METTAVSPTLPPAPSPGEGCPVPLAWQEVVRAFREQRDEFALPTSWGDVTVWEFGSGPPLVLLGGAAGDGDLFALTAWLLREELRCICIQWPMAPSGTRPQDWLPGWSQAVGQACAARGYSAVDLLGVGWGGVVALEVARTAPALVERLVLCGCIPRRCWTWRERLLLRLGTRSDQPVGRWPFWSRAVESNHRRWFPPFDAGRWEFLRENLAATSTRRCCQCLTAWGAQAMDERLREVHQPVLIVRTEGEGRLLTDGAEALAAGLPHARVEWLHSAGQFPHVTHPHRLVKLLRDFRSATPLRPAVTGG